MKIDELLAVCDQYSKFECDLLAADI